MFSALPVCTRIDSRERGGGTKAVCMSVYRAITCYVKVCESLLRQQLRCRCQCQLSVDTGKNNSRWSHFGVAHVRCAIPFIKEHFSYRSCNKMFTDIDECYIEILRLVTQAGSIINEKIYQHKDVLTKSSEVDLVTEWDQKVEKLLIEGISVKYPDHKFIGEESTASGEKVELTNAPTWIIDPIDGTMNFVHGLPHTCISVALLINKTTEIGIVYNPILGQLFTARKGQGAFLNGAPIHVSDKKELSKSLVMLETGTSRDPEKVEVVLQNIKLLVTRVHGLRTLGSAALNMCMVALGGADVYIEFGIHAWDIAAGDLIIREAGGVSIDPAGGPFDVLSRRALCASSIEVAQELSKILVQYYPERD